MCCCGLLSSSRMLLVLFYFDVCFEMIVFVQQERLHLGYTLQKSEPRTRVN